jgi:hypothetical protein
LFRDGITVLAWWFAEVDDKDGVATLLGNSYARVPRLLSEGLPELHCGTFYVFIEYHGRKQAGGYRRNLAPPESTDLTVQVSENQTVAVNLSNRYGRIHGVGTNASITP